MILETLSMKHRFSLRLATAVAGLTAAAAWLDRRGR